MSFPPLNKTFARSSLGIISPNVGRLLKIICHGPEGTESDADGQMAGLQLESKFSANSMFVWEAGCASSIGSLTVVSIVFILAFLYPRLRLEIEVNRGLIIFNDLLDLAREGELIRGVVSFKICAW